MAKYHWICPKCKTSLELRQRVTLTKRRCPECGTSIKTEAIITEAERAAREKKDLEDARPAYSGSLKFCRNDAGFNVFILPVDEPHESFGESVDELIFRFGIES